jgi:endonuclease G
VKRFVGLFALLLPPLVAGGLVVSLRPAAPAPAVTVAAQPYPHLPFGNLSGADQSACSNYLLKEKYFALSYNEFNGTPNWVSWTVTRSDLGVVARESGFHIDPLLPKAVRQPRQDWYAGSGYDLGHVCPHADRNATREGSYGTFVMTNVMPQEPNLNRGPWEGYEEWIRDQVRQNGDVAYVAAGPAGEAKVLNGPPPGTPEDVFVGKSIRVPARCWKVVYFTGGKDLPRRWSSVIMPNKPDCGSRSDWHKYQTDPVEVEELTGFKFVAPQ